MLTPKKTLSARPNPGVAEKMNVIYDFIITMLGMFSKGCGKPADDANIINWRTLGEDLDARNYPKKGDTALLI